MVREESILYPPYPDHDFLDEVEMICRTHERMWKDYDAYPFHENKLPKYLCCCAAEDDYSGSPEIVMYFGGDEIFAGEAPEYKKAFIRCGVKDYTIHVEPGLFQAYPMFTLVKEGKKGEHEIIEYLKA